MLAFTRVNADFRADLDRMELTGLIGAEHIFRSRKACIAAYQSEGQQGADAPAGPENKS